MSRNGKKQFAVVVLCVNIAVCMGTPACSKTSYAQSKICHHVPCMIPLCSGIHLPNPLIYKGQQRKKSRTAVKNDMKRAHNFVSSLERMVRREQQAVLSQQRPNACAKKAQSTRNCAKRGKHYQHFESKPVWLEFTVHAPTRHTRGATHHVLFLQMDGWRFEYKHRSQKLKNKHLSAYDVDDINSQNALNIPSRSAVKLNWDSKPHLRRTKAPTIPTGKPTQSAAASATCTSDRAAAIPAAASAAVPNEGSSWASVVRVKKNTQRNNGSRSQQRKHHQTRRRNRQDCSDFTIR